jgi:thioredoxin 1
MPIIALLGAGPVRVQSRAVPSQAHYTVGWSACSLPTLRRNEYMLALVYIFLGIFVSLVVFQYLFVLRSRKNRGRRVGNIGGIVGKAIMNGQRAMVYFYSPSCRACKYQTPTIDKLISRGYKVLKIDVSKDISTARKFGVMATPTTVVLEGDTIVEFLVGVKSEDKLKAYFL